MSKPGLLGPPGAMKLALPLPALLPAAPIWERLVLLRWRKRPNTDRWPEAAVMMAMKDFYQFSSYVVDFSHSQLLSRHSHLMAAHIDISVVGMGWLAHGPDKEPTPFSAVGGVAITMLPGAVTPSDEVESTCHDGLPSPVASGEPAMPNDLRTTTSTSYSTQLGQVSTGAQ
uniref:Uncharacterized protein n=1 Tax=Sphaerodactylus townsendi TaxID=933632 RepID=A0ACB8FGK8_9SAUR